MNAIHTCWCRHFHFITSSIQPYCMLDLPTQPVTFVGLSSLLANHGHCSHSLPRCRDACFVLDMPCSIILLCLEHCYLIAPLIYWLIENNDTCCCWFASSATINNNFFSLQLDSTSTLFQHFYLHIISSHSSLLPSMASWLQNTLKSTIFFNVTKFLPSRHHQGSIAIKRPW